VHGSIGVDLSIIESAVRLSEGGVHAPEDGWLLAPFRGHFHKEPDGTYRLISGHRIDVVAGRRHSRLPNLTHDE